MTLKIWNLKDELIYQNDNMNDLLHQYGIENAYLDTDNQEIFETELLSDIFDEENIQSKESYYELVSLTFSDVVTQAHTKSLYFKD